jgi:ADP-heptose:LPS heptosyltransferase
MDHAVYRKKWLRLREDAPDAERLQQLAREIAFSFTDKYFQNGTYVDEYIDLLCEMATSCASEELGNIVSSPLFELIVEKLCDDFEDLPIEVYSRVMCQVVSHCRAAPAGKDLDRRLTDFGMISFTQLYERAVTIHTRQHRWDGGRTPRKIILLSRVTLGADVAILSVMIQHLQHLFPQAGIVILGSRKLHGLFGGNPGVRIRELSYARRGGLFDRFAGWHAALEILREETGDGDPHDVLVIDPDSRISQLGVLPLVDGDRYLFFNTRHHLLASAGRCMAEWTNDWMKAVFDADDFHHPTVWLPPAIAEEARSRIDALRTAGAQRIIAMNLGVGQNLRKRVSDEFERRLLRTLVAVPGTIVVLDSGFGPDEVERSAGLAADTRAFGYAAIETSFGEMGAAPLPHGVVTVSCTIGQMASLIACSDEYIGYDSACQHIAAAARTPTLTVFAGSNNKNFVRRWSACGDTDCRIVHVDTLTDPQHVGMDEVISRIMHERNTRDRRGQFRIREVRVSQCPGAPAPEPTRE